jgi:hypothetical protein
LTRIGRFACVTFVSGVGIVRSPVKRNASSGSNFSLGFIRMSTSVRLLSQSFIFALTNRVSRESLAPFAVIAFIAKAEAVLRYDFAVAVSYQTLFTPPLACKEKGIPEQK